MRFTVQLLSRDQSWVVFAGSVTEQCARDLASMLTPDMQWRIVPDSVDA